MNDLDRSALQRIRTAFKRFFCLLLLLIRAFRERPGREETASERAEAAERVRNAMHMTQFGPFTGPASDKVLGKELGDGHSRPQRDPTNLN